MSRDDAWLQELARCYFDPSRVADLRLDDDPDPTDTTQDERHASVIVQVLRLADHEPEACWRFIELCCAMPFSEVELGLLGASVFEDLMDGHGLQFIDRVEAASRESTSVRAVVDAAWTNDMDQSVVRGIEAIQASPRPRRSYVR